MLQEFVINVDVDGNIIGTIGMAIDISEEKKSREALARSEQMAAVGEIASGIAHELNNPLAIISACTEVLIKGFVGVHPIFHLTGLTGE